MKNILLLYPPQWCYTSPQLAVPLLAGQLKSAGFNVKSVDLNALFFNFVLRRETLENSLESARKTLEMLSFSVPAKYSDADKSSDNLNIEEKTEVYRYRLLKRYFTEKQDEITEAIENIEEAVRVIRDKNDFFNPEKLFHAKHIVNAALRVFSLKYCPCELNTDNYFQNPLMNLDWENIKKQSLDRKFNMFADFYAGIIDSLEPEKYDMIGISMPDLSQLVSSFTLAKMLREHTNAHIAAGGNYLTQIHCELECFPEIFSDWFDSVTVGDGEAAITSLASGDGSTEALSTVPGLMYLDGNNVVFNEIKSVPAEKYRAYADFDDYDMKLYFTPDAVYPMQLSKGCYWGKCKFCDYYYGQQSYCPKSVESAIEELKYYVDRYGASKFIFVDEAIPPVYYERLAQAIIDAGLKINYYSFARLEAGFTKEVCRKLYVSGARMFLWGYETQSPRIIAKMNKGIDAEKRLEILKNAADAGIWNAGLFIFGYPTETADEINATMSVIKDNRDIIPSVTLSNFALKKHSLLKDSAEDEGIRGYSENGQFYTVYNDDIEGVPQSERRNIRKTFQADFLDENEHSLWPVIFSDFDHLLLFLSHYGLDFVRSYRSENRICPEFR